MQREVDAAATLGIEYVNVHLAHTHGCGRRRRHRERRRRTRRSVRFGGRDGARRVRRRLGTKLGGRFEHLAAVLEQSSRTSTCVWTPRTCSPLATTSRRREAVAETMAEFDDVVRFEHLECVHLNDSKRECGTNKDEHAHVGEAASASTAWKRSSTTTPSSLRISLVVVETPTEGREEFRVEREPRPGTPTTTTPDALSRRSVPVGDQRLTLLGGV